MKKCFKKDYWKKMKTMFETDHAQIITQIPVKFNIRIFQFHGFSFLIGLLQYVFFLLQYCMLNSCVRCGLITAPIHIAIRC